MYPGFYAVDDPGVVFRNEKNLTFDIGKGLRFFSSVKRTV
jgi:hypothetical protein